ncbi:MAG TPA: response regulator [Dictyoglomaceae bacterium]|nr:response regulator [Dictyoglomaceae bacterium]
MYRVIIADDEKIIREGIKKVIDWQKEGFKIICDASDGVDAYKKITRLKPELCLIDIKMPGLDGLELIKRITEEKIDTKVIIITGYPEFEYARKAIDLGVKTYLIKPIDPEVLLEKIRKIYEDLEKERREKITLTKSIELSREKILESIVRDNKTFNLEDINGTYDFDFPWDSYQIALIKPNDEKLILELKNFFQGYVFPIEDLICILLKEVGEREKRNLKRIRNLISTKYKIYSIISVGERVYNFSEIKNSFQSALGLLSYKFLIGEKGILYLEDFAENGKDSFIDDSEIILKLAKALEKQDFCKVEEILEIKMKDCIRRKLPEEDIKIRYLKIFLEILNQISYTYPQLENHCKSQVNEKLLMEFYKKENIFDLTNLLRGLLFDLMSSLPESQDSLTVSKITGYIEKNYFRNLRLKDLAEEFGYNSCYLGKIFKRNLGENFNTYLDKVRINKAKELLLKGLKVQEVAEKVGYEDVDYFTLKFKKYVGTCPKNFKDSYMLQKDEK